MKQRLKDFASAFLSATGSYRFLRPLYGGRGTVLAFHRVVGGPTRFQLGPNRALEIDATFLDAVVDFFRRHDFDFVSLDVALERLAAPQTQRRFVVFTFDDGYRDVATQIFPRLKKARVPFTLYLTPGFPDGSATPWWYLLEDLWRAQAAAPLRRAFALPEGDGTADDLFRRISALYFSPRAKEVTAVLHRLAEAHGIDENRYAEEELLSWDAITALARDPLVTLGAHGGSHLPLAQLDDAAAAAEIGGSCAALEAKIQRAVRHFCYPYGTGDTAGAREYALCRKAGLRSAVTSRLGNLFAKHLANPFALPRLTIGGPTESIRTVDERLCGLPFIRTGPFRALAVIN